MTKIKICGITNDEDARQAVECGADALGFNFYKGSPRFITTDKAASIIIHLPPTVACIGVFVNEEIEQMERTAAYAGLTMLQLHGDESPDLVAKCVAHTGLPLIKALRIGPTFVPRDAANYSVDSILLDAYCAGNAGGTGMLCDWRAAAEVRSVVPKLYLAGGLNGDNVAEAIRSVRPFAVDACSLLETRPGKKDHGKVAAFIAAAKATI
jgi:phosphoribosylanthranilate isomerase